MTLKTRSYQGIKETSDAVAKIVTGFIENMEKRIERDKTISHYAVFNPEIYRKKLVAEKEKEKVKIVDFIKYSIN